MCLRNDFCFSTMRVIGPIMLVIGLALVISGVAVCVHYRKQLTVPAVLYVSRRCINILTVSKFENLPGRQNYN